MPRTKLHDKTMAEKGQNSMEGKQEGHCTGGRVTPFDWRDGHIFLQAAMLQHPKATAFNAMRRWGRWDNMLDNTFRTRKEHCYIV